LTLIVNRLHKIDKRVIKAILIIIAEAVIANTKILRGGLNKYFLERLIGAIR